MQQCCINQREMTAAREPCKRMTERKSAFVPAGWRCRTGECRPSVPGVPACRNYNTGNLCQASAFMRRGGITDAPSDKHRLRRLRMLFLGRAPQETGERLVMAIADRAEKENKKIPEIYISGISGAPCEIRTHDLLIRSQTLYPAELRAHAFLSDSFIIIP